MNLLRPSRRQVMGASLIGGIAVYLAPLGSRAFAALFEEQLLTRPAWNDGVLKYRIDATSKRYFRTPSFHAGRVSNCSSNNAAKALLPSGAR